MNEKDLQDFLPPWLWQYLEKLNAKERAQFLAQYGEAVQQMLSRLEDLPLNKQQEVMMPGSAKSQSTVTEWVGEATQKCYITFLLLPQPRAASAKPTETGCPRACF